MVSEFWPDTGKIVFTILAFSGGKIYGTEDEVFKWRSFLVPIQNLRPLLYCNRPPINMLKWCQILRWASGTYRISTWQNSVRYKPGRWQKNAFWATSQKMSSERQIKNLRPLSYYKYPPHSLKSVIRIQFGGQEGIHSPFFAWFATYRDPALYHDTQWSRADPFHTFHDHFFSHKTFISGLLR